MIEKYIPKITLELKLQPRQVAATALLLGEEGATVLFIARYRKERTGELDEVQITAIRDRIEQLTELDKRRANPSFRRSPSASSLPPSSRPRSTPPRHWSPWRISTFLSARRSVPRPPWLRKGPRALADLFWAQDPATNPETEAQAYAGRREYEVDGNKATIADTAEGPRRSP